jgi:hypothetical protein
VNFINGNIENNTVDINDIKAFEELSSRTSISLQREAVLMAA